MIIIFAIDLKCDNIMLDSNMSVKVIDFGFARFSTDFICGKVGSYGCAAPEIFEKTQYDGKKADIFSLGVILFKIFGSKHSKLNFLIRKMLDPNPDLRPDIHTIRQNDVFLELPYRGENCPFDYDLFFPVKDLQENSFNEVSALFDLSIEELNSLLQSEDSNIYKLIYYLNQEKKYPLIHSQKSILTARCSFSLPDQLTFHVDDEQMKSAVFGE
jgi:serine/threonine protein kinase